MQLKYEYFDSFDEISESDRELIEAAREAARGSYSPYSNFSVGSAARLLSGEIIKGTNIESEVYPQGLCAERTLLFSAAVNHPHDPITDFVVTSISTPNECYPCGACRQSLLDAERRQGAQIRVIMAGATTATVVESAALLLPFSFKLT